MKRVMVLAILLVVSIYIFAGAIKAEKFGYWPIWERVKAIK